MNWNRRLAPLALCTVLCMALALVACGGQNGAGGEASLTETAAPAGTAGSANSEGGSEAAGNGEAVDDGDELVIVTTVFAPYDFIREIAGAKANVSMLLPPGSETHSFEPTPQDMITIQNSDMFIYVGGDSDGWVETILGSMDRDSMTIVALLDLVDAVEEELVEGMQAGHTHDDDHDDHEHGEDEEHDDHDHEDDTHGEEAELDEHVWTSPKNAIRIVDALAGTLGGIDAENAGAYRENADAYIAQLQELDAAFEEAVQNGTRDTLVFGDRFPFRYLADAYGLAYYAAFPGCSTETEPSAQTVAFLIDKVADENVPVVFYIEMSNMRMADTICEATGAEKLLLHSCHNVTKDEMNAGETYLSLMWQNVENLKTALA